MEFLISTQDERRLFTGNLPTNFFEYLRRLQLAKGVAASNFAANKRQRRGDERAKLEKSKSQRRLELDTLVDEIFFLRYAKKEARSMHEGHVPRLLAIATANAKPDDTTFTSMQEQWTTDHLLTTAQYIHLLWRVIHLDTLARTFDYMSLHSTCISFLQDLQTQFTNLATRRLKEENMSLPPRSPEFSTLHSHGSLQWRR